MNKNQAFIFFGIILAGLGISLYTLNQFGEKRVEGGGDSVPEPLMGKGSPDGGASGGSPEEKKPESEKPKEMAKGPAKSGDEAVKEKAKAEEKRQSLVFKSPEALAGALIDAIKNRDVDGFLGLAGEGAINPLIRPQVEGLVRNDDWVVNPERPATELAKSAQGVRWAINFDGKAPDGAAAATSPASAGSGEDPVTTQLFADFVSSEDKSNWSVSKIALPLDFAEKTGLKPGAVAMKPGESGTDAANPGATAAGKAAPGSASMPEPGNLGSSDALTVAFAFSQALLNQNFELARGLTDHEQVTDERVAALMIALEEGDFHLRDDKPLIVTLSRDDLTWVLARVDSESAGSEFALEMGRPGGGGEAEWKIHGLTFSKLISALADQAGAGGVAYAPIVANPQGGDSLVLYFEFDESGVSVRSSRQLKIVAEILKNDPSRKIHINGHADALGTDDYNESLSNQRAAAIRAKLLEYGVGGEQVVTKAYGEAMPRRPNFNPDGTDNPGNRSQNRRAEVYLDF